jgi:hypothetical protein
MPKMARALTRDEREAAATATYEVTGALPIRDAVTRESVQPGGTVRLDPTRTNIDALIEAGSLKPLPAKAEKGKG